MSYNLSNKAYPEPRRSLAFGSISGTYARVGLPLVFPSRVLVISNFTDVEVDFSWDGVDVHLTMASNQSIVIDVAAAKSTESGALYFGTGQQFYAASPGGDPSTGHVYISTFYGVPTI